MLKYVINQDRELCLKAVKINGYALQYVKEQDKEICIKALEENAFALQYVRDLSMIADDQKEENPVIDVTRDISVRLDQMKGYKILDNSQFANGEIIINHDDKNYMITVRPY